LFSLLKKDLSFLFFSCAIFASLLIVTCIYPSCLPLPYNYPSIDNVLLFFANEDEEEKKPSNTSECNRYLVQKKKRTFVIILPLFHLALDCTNIIFFLLLIPSSPSVWYIGNARRSTPIHTYTGMDIFFTAHNSPWMSSSCSLGIFFSSWVLTCRRRPSIIFFHDYFFWYFSLYRHDWKMNG
jgi:hypothetical protein